MAKKEQSYKNDDIVWHIDKWFETHTGMSLDNYEMLCQMVHYKRGRK